MGQGAPFYAVEQRGFPRSGRRVLQPAGSGSLQQLIDGNFPIQVMGAQSVRSYARVVDGVDGSVLLRWPCAETVFGGVYSLIVATSPYTVTA